MRRGRQRQHLDRRVAEQAARCGVVAACQSVAARGAPVIEVTRHLALSDRTVRRWRQADGRPSSTRRGRPPRCASREARNQVYRFLKQRGPATPLAGLRAAFPHLRRADLADVLQRFRRVARRRRDRRQSRLEWRRSGAVWAADFKERREPLEGRYGWLLSMKDLASGFQLAWEPLAEATSQAVCAMYTRLFVEHGPPLILKSDNGKQFTADETKALLAAERVIPLYSPKRRPQYNGGVERANGQLASYQEALAEHHRRPAGPTCDDAEGACQLANELAHPHGWRGPSARELWDARLPLTAPERVAFLNTVEQLRGQARAHWNFPPDVELAHYPAAAIDRRAVRDALLRHDLLRIHPCHTRRQQKNAADSSTSTQPARSAGTISESNFVTALSTVDGGTDSALQTATESPTGVGEATNSANKPSASGKN